MNSVHPQDHTNPKLCWEMAGKFQQILDLFEDPKRWTQGAAARNRQLRAVPSRAGEAVCWCLLGAGQKVGLPDPMGYGGRSVNSLIQPFITITPNVTPAGVNDRFGLPAVRKVLQDAMHAWGNQAHELVNANAK